MVGASRLALGAMIGLLGLSAGVVSAVSPSSARTVLLGAAVLAILVLLRSRVRDNVRAATAGLLLGTGGLTFQLVGGLASYAIAGAIYMAAPVKPSSLSTRYVTWIIGAVLLFGGLGMTAFTARVPAAMWGTCSALVAASRWPLFGGMRAARCALTQIAVFAGAAASLGVLVSAVIGHPIFGTTDNLLRNSAVGGAMRAAGFFAAPNEAALVLSAACLVILLALVWPPPVTEVRPLWHSSVLAAVLALSVASLTLTGSRSSLLGLYTSSLILMLVIARTNARSAAMLGSALLLAALITPHLAVFGGRSFDVLGESDVSAAYRSKAQAMLWSRLDLSHLVGFGFRDGNVLAHNPITVGYPNVDNAWLMSALAIGIIGALGVAVLLLTGLLTGLSNAGVLAMVPAPWILFVTISENVWSLAAPGVMAFIVVASFSISTEASRGQSSSLVVKYALVRARADQSAGLGIGPDRYGRRGSRTLR
jgi:hypothetical protein